MIKVLMIGPARSVKGGMTTVVNNYYDCGLANKVNLLYLESCNDKNIFFKFFKEIIGFIMFLCVVNKYDILHIHVASRRSTFRKALYLRVAKRMGKKVILHIHGAEYKIFYNECNDRKKEYINKVLNLADKVIVLSEEWKDFFENLIEKNKIVVIYNSVVLPKDFNKNLDSNSFLFLGRIGERKGIFDLLDVFEELVHDYPSLKLYVGGDGEVERLKEAIKIKSLEHNVEYIGWISGDKKIEYLKKCSFYILPSYNEGMPMSVLEGMAYKNVTISTNVGGIPKVIDNENNGIIINPGDKMALKEYIIDLVNNSKFRTKLSRNARKTIEKKFNIDLVINQLVELYENI